VERVLVEMLGEERTVLVFAVNVLEGPCARWAVVAIT
jgi:hypothetical protein